MGALVGAACGALDGLVAWWRAPRGDLSRLDAVTLAALGAVALASVTSVAGLAHAVVGRAASARQTLRDARAWLSGGPARWFDRDHRGALRVVMAVVGALVASLAGYALALRVVRSVRTPSLAAASLLATGALSLGLGAVAGLVAAWLLERPMRRAERLASPGAVALVAAGVACAVAFVGAVLARGVLARIAWGGPLGAIACAAAYVWAERASARRRVAVGRGHAAAAAAVMALSLAWAGRSLGRSQAVLDAVTSRALVASRVYPALQRASDRDGDGYGRWFGGGDCDDRDPRVNPFAREVPGNGRDENCSGFDAPPMAEERAASFVAPATSHPSVVLLSIDTARPDHTSLYGYHRPTTPTLARLAARGARFDRAYAAAPQTVRSFAAAFTGRYPASLCWGRDPQFPPLRDRNEMLAEALRAEGYATSVFTNSSYFALTAGFFQGFDTIDQGGGFKDDAQVTTWRANTWLERAGRDPRPFFAWVHLIDPHEPYTDRTTPQDFGHEPVDRYDEEIAYADAALGRLVPTLEAIAAARPLVVIAMSDHGEGFGEHGSYYHSYDAHEESLRAVLVVQGPGVVPGARAQLVSLVDLFPTLMGYIDRPPPPRAPSRSLIPVLQSAPGTSVPWRSAVLADVSHTWDARAPGVALVAPPWKLLHDPARGAWELYHLERDPAERRNVFNREPAVAEQLRARLAELVRQNSTRCAGP